MTPTRYTHLLLTYNASTVVKNMYIYIYILYSTRKSVYQPIYTDNSEQKGISLQALEKFGHGSFIVWGRLKKEIVVRHRQRHQS